MSEVNLSSLDFGFMELPRDLDETVEIARHAEAAGYHWMGIADSPVVYQESYIHQADALRATSQIRVGAVVSHTVARHPVVIGNLLSTLSELGDGRTIGTLATGNSAARGLGLKPATVSRLEEGVRAIRGYWEGDGGTYGDSSIPASGIRRPACPILVAGDGPRVVALGGEAGDGVLYGGTLAEQVLRRRVASVQGKPFWVAAPVSLGEDPGEVTDDMGAMLVAIANRAFRGDLIERGVPESLHDDVRRLWDSYDYGYHADNSRPQNLRAVSPPLLDFLLDNFVIWGDTARWRSQLDFLAAQGCAGVMFVLGQATQADVITDITSRLRELGGLPHSPSVPQ